AGRSYRPLLDEPNLFLRFAETEPTAEGVLAFANRFGRLGQDAAWRIRKVRPQDEEPSAIYYNDYHRRRPPPGARLQAEPLFVWQSYIAVFAHLVRLWELALQGEKGWSAL